MKIKLPKIKFKRPSWPMLIMLACVGILFGLIFAWKGFQGIMMKRYFASQKDLTVTVSTMMVGYSPWQSALKGVGSARATLGVNVTTSLAGTVDKVYFTPGMDVTEGTLLVQLNAGTEIGQLQALIAQVELAKITYERDKAQFAAKAISKQALDIDKYNLQNLQGQVASQTATVAKKTIRAPFAGRLGISQIYPGQYVNPGDTIVTLQTLDPMWVDFYLPQQALDRLRVGQTVTVKTDTYPNKVFKGKVTTIQPIVDVSTRNVQVEATVANPHFELTPGMFTTVEVIVGKPKPYPTIPQTAVSFNPYGSIVYVVEETRDADYKSVYKVKQVFVKTGETRGDQVTVLSGIHAGQIIVTSGQLKLKNGSKITMNNTVQPDSDAQTQVTNDHT